MKRKETVFSISREYGISEAELIAANPELKGENKIKKGTFLCIPYPKAQTEQNIQSQAIPTDSELFRENRKKTERFSTIKAAVILPFLDGVSKSESSRMVEYYEGLLMAVDSLKRPRQLSTLSMKRTLPSAEKERWTAGEKYFGINIGKCGKNTKQKDCAGLWIMTANGYGASS